jgi:hypothetical protein
MFAVPSLEDCAPPVHQIGGTSHLRWYDHWSQLLLHLAWCAHWFNPVVWFSLRRLRADRELAADEWVLRHLTGERSLAYGETLFKTVANRSAVGFSFQQGLVGISEDGAQMKQRLQRITSFLPRRQVYGSLAGLAALLLLGTVVLGQGSSTHDINEATHPALSPAPALPQQLTVTPKTEKTFAAGEGIEIRQITGTNVNFEIGGTYRVKGVCRQHTLKNATLYLGNTADAGADAIVPALGTSLSKPLPPGSTEFDFTFQLLRPGVVHVTVYDLDNPDKKDNAYAGVVLGTVAVPTVAVENAVGPTKPAPPTAQDTPQNVVVGVGSVRDPAALPAQTSVQAAAQPAEPARAIHVHGMVSTADGAPIGVNVAKIHLAMTFGASGMRYYNSGPDSPNPDGTLNNMQIPSDATDVIIGVSREGYAPAFAGPFSAPLEEKLKDLHLTLSVGYDAAIQTVNEAGQPIVGARLEVNYALPVEVGSLAAATDTSGSATLKRLGEAPLDIRVRADGYQADEIQLERLDSAKPYQWTLKKAQPLAGYVIAAASGRPILGAKIRMAAVRGPHVQTCADASTAPLLATTNAQGMFTLTSMRPDSQYYLFVAAPGYGGVLLPQVNAGQPKLKVALGPELSVRGHLRHISPTSINAYDGTFTFGYDQFFDIGGSVYAVGQQAIVKPVNGQADFAIGSLYNNSLLIIADGKETKLEAKDLPKSDLLIDLAEKAPAPAATSAVTPP